MPAPFRLHGTLINLFSDYLPLPCHWVEVGAPEWSYALGPIPARTHPIYFEAEYGRLSERNRYTQKQLKRRGPAKPFVTQLFGMQDLFVPVPDGKGGNGSYILLGSFHQAIPTRAELWARWCKLRRQPGAEDGDEFLAYARTLLEVPVLEAPVVARLGQVLSTVGAALQARASGAQADKAVAAIDAAKREILGRQLPWRMWNYAEARRDRLHRGPFQGAELAPWDAQEFKLKRGPDSVVALVLRDADADPVDALANGARLQWACYELCREEEGLVAGRLGDEGACALFAGTRLQARDRAIWLAQALSKRLGRRVVAAHRSEPRQPPLLDQAIRQTEAALRLALAQGQDLVEAGPQDLPEGLGGGVEALSERLAVAAAEGREKEQRLLRQSLSTEALRVSGGRSDALRVHLRWSLSPLLKRLARREEAGAVAALAAEAERQLLRAGSAGELVRAHSALCDELALRLREPAQGDRRSRLRRAAGRVQSAPEAELRLDQLARDSGFSVHHFSRLFKASTGLGFAQARLEARLAKARRLLAQGPLPIAAVASDCGFKNSAHFSAAFRRSEGLSPSLYRRKNNK